MIRGCRKMTNTPNLHDTMKQITQLTTTILSDPVTNEIRSPIRALTCHKYGG
jgi:hypothetical protein